MNFAHIKRDMRTKMELKPLFARIRSLARAPGANSLCHPWLQRVQSYCIGQVSVRKFLGSLSKSGDTVNGNGVFGGVRTRYDCAGPNPEIQIWEIFGVARGDLG